MKLLQQQAPLHPRSPFVSELFLKRIENIMSPRFTAAEKGKMQLSEPVREKVKKIKAPRLDNSALIKENALPSLGGSQTT